ncbi:[LysW]-aminoadipate kinase [Anaerolineae bacterium CFX9]|nr:[LysW]-aminoadipate kinase [Anaerolineae bacterium CFX9]
MHILKIGGGAGVDHERALDDIAARIRAGERWVIVHGASDAANQLGEQVGYPARTITSVSGHTSRYNDARTIELFSMAAAAVNQQMTAGLLARGVNAVGLASPNVLYARRKTAIRALMNGRQVIIRDDYSGAIHAVNSDLLETLLNAGMTPVVAPLALGEAYERLNVDGDLAAAQIARALNADALVILSNVPGLLRDLCDPDSLVTEIPLNDLDRYEHFASGRMKKKLLAAREAQIARVILADSRRDQPLTAALNGGGTQIARDPALFLEADYA